MNLDKYIKIELMENDEDIDFENESEHIISIIDQANKELEKHYSGKYKFKITNEKKGIDPSKLKISPKRKRRIKEIWLKFNSDLSNIQRQYEKFLQTSLQKDPHDV